MTAAGRGYAIAYLQDVDVGPEVIDYMERIEGTFQPFGGEWLVHGTTPEVVEGELPGTLVVIGFPTVAAARSWYESPGYQAILGLRTRNSTSVAVLVEGVPPGYRAEDTVAKLLGR